MGRRLFAVASAVSLLVCVGSVGLWVRSYRADEGFVYYRWNSLTFARLDRGKLSVMTLDSTPKATGFRWVRWAGQLDWQQYPSAPGTFGGGSVWHRRQFFGVHFLSGFQEYLISKAPDWKSREIPYRMWVIPLWLPLGLMLILPVIAFLSYARQLLGHARPPGSCPRCHYSLTGNTSGICPECGTPVPKQLDECGLDNPI